MQQAVPASLILVSTRSRRASGYLAPLLQSSPRKSVAGPPSFFAKSTRAGNRRMSPMCTPCLWSLQRCSCFPENATIRPGSDFAFVSSLRPERYPSTSSRTTRSSWRSLRANGRRNLFHSKLQECLRRSGRSLRSVGTRSRRSDQRSKPSSNPSKTWLIPVCGLTKHVFISSGRRLICENQIENIRKHRFDGGGMSSAADHSPIEELHLTLQI